MAKIYDKKINRSTDWGGDSSTENLPVSGKRVQEFIKGELNEKVGDIYLNTGTSRYLCFANADARNEYLSTNDSSLILGEFEAISNYSVDIIDTTSIKSVLSTSSNNRLSFKFRVTNNNTKMPTGEAVSITYTFNNGGTVNSFTEDVYPKDEDSEGYTTISFLIDDYVKVGTNNITIKIIGKNTFAASQIGMTFEVLDLSYNPTFNYNKSWNSTEKYISVSYTIECAKVKYIEWWIDGAKATTDTMIQDTSYGATMLISTNALSAGVHSLQTRAYVLTGNNTKFYGENHYYTFAVAGSSNPCVLIKKVIESGDLVGSSNALTLTTTQFESLSFEWSFYDPQNRTLTVDFLYDAVNVASIAKNNNDDPSIFNYKPVNAGDATLMISINDEEGENVYQQAVGVVVEESAAALSETTGGLILKLSAIGRSNDEPEETRNKWEYTYVDGTFETKYSTTFNGFAWNSQQGWYNDALVLSDGAYIDINIRPMGNQAGDTGDWANNGKGGAVEIDIETFDVEDDDAIICECTDGGDTSASFKITATAASIKSSGSDVLTTRFKDNDRMKLVFIGNPAGNLEDSNILYIVNNGVLERAVNYSNGDTIVSQSTLRIGDLGGQGKVKCRVRSIRVYNRAISVDESFNNYVIDSDNVQAVYEKNDIYKAGSTTEVDYDKIVNKLPVMILTGNLPLMMQKATKSYTDYFDIEFINLQDPSKNFVAFHVKTKLQGTSSLGYPRKNYKINTKNKEATVERYDTLDYSYNKDTKRLYVKSTGEEVNYSKLTETFMFDKDGNLKPKGKYVFKDNAVKTDKFVLKADYMESSGSHNTGAGRSWNDIFKNVQLSNTNTYLDSAIEKKTGTYNAFNKKEGESRTYTINESKIANQSAFVCRTQAQKISQAYNAGEVRTAIDGFPMVMFYRLNHDSDLVFMGQYNFNNDKATQEVFGWEDIHIDLDGDGTKDTYVFDSTECECWEGLKNTHPISLFKSVDNFDREWADTFEVRWPDKDDVDAAGNPLYTITNVKELCTWVVSTRHERDTVIDNNKQITIDSSFAKKLNKYQYGYTLNADGEVSSNTFKYAESGTYPDTAENRQKKFEAEKWEHFDVWKLAGYYIYLLRYGAVDQFVKNTMLTTEGVGKYGGKYKKWYYINYDNDCLFGLRNNGVLAFDYTLNRDTIDPVYAGYTQEQLDEEDIDGRAMMGNQSTLWNNLEKDDEFMRMVRDLDDAMHSVGLTYEGLLKVFDEGQTDAWPERIYNANERYKYIQPFAGTADYGGQVNNLFMLQGTRKAHRHWWISNHMEYYDAKWISGDYKSKILEMKADGEMGKKIDIEAAFDFYYAWGNNSTLFESNVVLKPGDKYSFVAPIAQVQGDPIRVYAINKIKSIDVSNYGAGIQQVNFAKISAETTHELKKVIIGGTITNSGLKNVDSIANVPNIEYLDITNCKGITDISFIKNLNKLTTLKAAGSSISSFAPAEGTKFNLVELPSTIQSLNLPSVTFTKGLSNTLKYTVTTNLKNIYISTKNSKGLDYGYYSLVKQWLTEIYSKTNDVKKNLLMYASLNLINVNWTLTDVEDVYLFEEFKKGAGDKNFNITGTIDLRGYPNLTRDDLERLRKLFGENCFKQSNSLHIIAPTSIFIESENDEIVAGKENKFYCTIYPEKPESSYRITYTIVDENLEPITDVRAGATFTNEVVNGEEVAMLRTEELCVGSDTTFNVLVTLSVVGALLDKTSVMSFTIKEPTYPAKAELVGSSSIKISDTEYVYQVKPLTTSNEEALGSFDVTWDVTGDGLDYFDMDNTGVDANDQTKFIIKTNGDEPETSSRFNIKATISCHDEDLTTFPVERNLLFLNRNVIMTKESNSVAMSVCHSKGWCGEDAMSKLEAEAVTDIGTAFAGKGSNTGFSLSEVLPYFTSLTTIQEGAFAKSKIKDIELPSTITAIGQNAFSACTLLTAVTINEGITTVPNNCFNGCLKLANIALPSTVTTIGHCAFGNTAIRKIVVDGSDMDTTNALVVPDTLYEIASYAFEASESWDDNSTSNKLVEINIPATLRNMELDLFRGPYLTTINVSENNLYFKVEDGVLYDKLGETLLRYPAMLPGETYEIKTCYTISPYAFFNTKLLKEVIFNTSITTVGGYAFAKSNVEAVDMLNGFNVKELPIGCFKDCVNLVDMMLSTTEGLIAVRNQCFYNCESLSTITFPGSVTIFGSELFVNCSVLETVNFPKPSSYVQTTIGSSLFRNCGMIEEIELPRYSSTNTSEVIVSCQSLTAVTLPVFSYYKPGLYTVTIIGENNLEEKITFEYRADAEAKMAEYEHATLSVELEQENVVINTAIQGWEGSGSDAYFIRNCGKLVEYKANEMDNGQYLVILDGIVYTDGGRILNKFPFAKDSIQFTDNVEEVSSYAFNACTKLTDLTLPKTISIDGVKTRAFSKFSGLVNFDDNGTMGSIEQYTFLSCSNLETAIFGNENLSKIDIWSFYGCSKLRHWVILAKKAPTFGIQVLSSSSIITPFYGYGGFNMTLYTSFGVDFETDETNGTNWTLYYFNGSNITKKTYELDDTIHISIKDADNGIVNFEQIYVNHEDGHSSDIAGAFNALTGVYDFAISNVYNNEQLNIVADGNVIGSINPWRGNTDFTITYTQSDNLPGTSSGIMMMSLYDEQSVEDTKVETVTKYQYDLLEAKVNQLISKLNGLV